MKSRNFTALFVAAIFLFSVSSFAQSWKAGTGTLYTNPTTTYVGIGTTTPHSPLELINTADRLAIFYDNASANSNSTISVGNSTSTNKNVLNIGFHADPTESKRFGYISVQGVAYSTQMAFSTTGSVGIGTTSPGSYKLAVEGKIGARELVITASAWADHVFNPNYNLKPLNDVEKFIKTNNHLEGIPTAKEVKTNGVAVGEIQAKLLQKVEELTLYVIEQNKKIEQLSKSNKELYKRLNNN
jgi:hypothetical protein